MVAGMKVVGRPASSPRSAGVCGSSPVRWRCARHPFVVSDGIGEARASVLIAGGISAAALGRRKVSVKSALLGHRIQEILHQGFVAITRGEKTDLA